MNIIYNGRVCPFVRLSDFPLCMGHPSYGWSKRDVSYKFKRREEIQDQPINIRNLAS